MREDNASREISPTRRRQEVAAILAAGVLRYRRMARKTGSSPAQESADLQQNSLLCDGRAYVAPGSQVLEKPRALSCSRHITKGVSWSANSPERSADHV